MLPTGADDRAHHRRRFSGRDPAEDDRAATPLELLYDLTIVVAFSTASNELAHYVAEDHVGPGLAGFAFAAFAVSWAWLNYTWFGSAYDTVVSVALPLALYVSVYYGLYSALMRTSDRFHLGLLAGTGAVLVLSLALAATGTSMAVCLVVLAFAPAVTVVGYEVLGYRHMADAIERL